MFKRCLSIKGKSQTDSALDFTSVSQQNSFPTKNQTTKLYKTQKLYQPPRYLATETIFIYSTSNTTTRAPILFTPILFLIFQIIYFFSMEKLIPMLERMIISWSCFKNS